MDTKKQIIVLRALLDMTQEELARELGVSFETVNRWESGKNAIEDYNLEKLHAFAFNRKVYLNQIYEQFLKEGEIEGRKVLFHGSRKDFSLPLDLSHSRPNNDFGMGFYLGENLKQAAMYVSNLKAGKVYAFSLNEGSLKEKRFGVSREWMLAIAYYRGWINGYRGNRMISNILEEVEKSDVVIAPIADNRMFDIISEFARGEITDLQCQHALSATNLGMQYVLRSEKALDNASFLDCFYISKSEKESLLKQRLDLNSLGLSKVKASRIEYRGKGRYIDELLK